MTISQILCEPTILPGILFVIISIPLLLGKIPMNNWYGFRIEKAFVSNENWYAINKYGAKQMILWSALLIMVGIVLLFVPLTPLLGVVPLIAVVLVTIGRTLSYASTLPGQ